VKSYLAGNPAIRLALNDDLVIGRQGAEAGGASRWGGSFDVVQVLVVTTCDKWIKPMQSQQLLPWCESAGLCCARARRRFALLLAGMRAECRLKTTWNHHDL